MFAFTKSHRSTLMYQYNPFICILRISSVCMPPESLVPNRLLPMVLSEAEVEPGCCWIIAVLRLVVLSGLSTNLIESCEPVLCSPVLYAPGYYVLDACECTISQHRSSEVARRAVRMSLHLRERSFAHCFCSANARFAVILPVESLHIISNTLGFLFASSRTAVWT